ncbi:ABC transporter substrate-binding protein, partial [bacterium]|jgi:ABC-type branched-subunit amino acid transport system substrate-binding protein|nr:ABC transporter substrate-binding protein [bacterium]
MNSAKLFRSLWRHLGALSLAGSALFATTVLAEPGVTTDSINLGQSTALSGPLGDLGQEVLKGAKVYFDGINARGGVHGRNIKLVSKDDAYDTAKTLENVNAFIAEDNTFALFGTFGTPNNEALIPIAQSAGLPVFMPYTGAPSIRSKTSKGVYNLRASYADEVERLIEHLNTVGVKKIAIAYQNNAFGKEVLKAANAAMDARKLKPLLAVPVENDATDAAPATEKLLATQPEAVLLALAGKPTIEVIRNITQRRKGMQMYALSVLATPANLRALGKDGSGVAITQVVPFPANATMPLVREYQQAMVAAGLKEFSHLSLEGYLNAKLVTEALRRAGPKLTRVALTSAMDSIRGFNMGGLDVTFGQGAASGSRFVELTMVNAQGKLIK